MNALILAGSRPGAADPVAEYAGVAHKALIVLGGETLLARVAAAVRAAGATRVAVSADHPAVLAEAAPIHHGNTARARRPAAARRISAAARSGSISPGMRNWLCAVIGVRT